MDEDNKDIQTALREEQTRLINILEAFEVISKSKEWEVLRTEVFDKSLKSIERQQRVECLNQVINQNRLYELKGEWSWAKQFTDVNRFTENLKKTLEEIKKRI